MGKTSRRSFIKRAGSGLVGVAVGAVGGATVVGLRLHTDPAVLQYASDLYVVALYQQPESESLTLEFVVGGYRWKNSVKKGESARLSLWGRVKNDGTFVSYGDTSTYSPPKDWGRHFDFLVEDIDNKERKFSVEIYKVLPVIVEDKIREYERGALWNKITGSDKNKTDDGEIIFYEKDLDEIGKK